ncbi:DNA-binding NarL/FixJ family response regulator [Variovorax boronicumulans]|uniref:helix-turn-helix domain-containing protein n=1 Tax=Variovorax boronicumulans TaxID=436515 RepID=UPI002780C9CB|nr:helix-turn-helix domain-containing protein [Variovorax boronicumulans]MDP9919812.1 DNA-binding NarL/FixJ family response regulator [Variovorax boronicumulans]
MTDVQETLLRICGPALVARITRELAGQTIRVPAIRTTTAARRRERVARLLSEGVPCPVIAERIGVTLRRVQQLASERASTMGVSNV